MVTFSCCDSCVASMGTNRVRVPASTIIPLQSQASERAKASANSKSVVRDRDATSQGVSPAWSSQPPPESPEALGDQRLSQFATAQKAYLEIDPPRAQHKPVKGDVVITGVAASKFGKSIQTVDAVCEGQVCNADAPCAFDASEQSQKDLEVAKAESFSGAWGFPILGKEQLNRNQIMLTVRQPPCLSYSYCLVLTSSFNNRYALVDVEFYKPDVIVNMERNQHAVAEGPFQTKCFLGMVEEFRGPPVVPRTQGKKRQLTKSKAVGTVDKGALRVRLFVDHELVELVNHESANRFTLLAAKASRRARHHYYSWLLDEWQRTKPHILKQQKHRQIRELGMLSVENFPDSLPGEYWRKNRPWQRTEAKKTTRKPPRKKPPNASEQPVLPAEPKLLRRPPKERI